MMYEDDDEDALPLMEYIEQFKGIVEIKRLNDLQFVATQLEEHHLFESANEMRIWYRDLKEYIAEEFDEGCLTEPIPNLISYVPVVDHELDDGWIHEEYINPALLPPLEGGDSGTFRYGPGENPFNY